MTADDATVRATLSEANESDEQGNAPTAQNKILVRNTLFAFHIPECIN